MTSFGQAGWAGLAAGRLGVADGDRVVQRDLEADNYVWVDNPIYGEPFDAKKGYGYFRSCYTPIENKITCFGAEKVNQNIKNADSLLNIISRFQMRTKSDIPYDISFCDVPMTAREEDTYEWVLTDFKQRFEELRRELGDSALKTRIMVVHP